MRTPGRRPAPERGRRDEVRRSLPYRSMIACLAAVLLSVSLMNITGTTRQGLSFWERAWVSLETGISGLFQTAYSWCQSVAASFSSKQELIEENERLKRQVAVVDSLEARVSELETEVERLKNLLRFQEQVGGGYVAARVVSRTPSKWFSTMIVSVGKKQGVYLNAPVISQNGLVGRVITVEDSWSAVLLLTDPESSVGAVVADSRDHGIVSGGSSRPYLTMQFFSRDAQVEEGDRVVTSGMGSFYPAGILIGEVESVSVPKPGLVKVAKIRPATDFDHLEEVLVAVSPG